MSDLKEYLDLKKQYEKLKETYTKLSNIIIDHKASQTDLIHSLGFLNGLKEWFLVKIQDLEKKAND